MHLKHACLPISPPEHGMLKQGIVYSFPRKIARGIFIFYENSSFYFFLPSPFEPSILPPHLNLRRKRRTETAKKESRFQNPDFRLHLRRFRRRLNCFGSV